MDIKELKEYLKKHLSLECEYIYDSGEGGYQPEGYEIKLCLDEEIISKIYVYLQGDF